MYVVVLSYTYEENYIDDDKDEFHHWFTETHVVLLSDVHTMYSDL